MKDDFHVLLAVCLMVLSIMGMALVFSVSHELRGERPTTRIEPITTTVEVGDWGTLYIEDRCNQCPDCCVTFDGGPRDD